MTNDPMTIGRGAEPRCRLSSACRLLLSATAPLLGLLEHALHGAERVRIRGLEDPVAAVIRIAGDRHAAKEAIAVAGGRPKFRADNRWPPTREAAAQCGEIRAVEGVIAVDEFGASPARVAPPRDFALGGDSEKLACCTPPATSAV